VTWLNTRRLPVLLAAATLMPAVVLVWLGVRLLQQDRELDRQRQRERLEVAAGRVALEIDRRLQDLEAELVAGHGIRLHESGIEAVADGPILFQPADGPAAQPSPAEIAPIEVEEFQRRNLTGAEAAYRRFSTSGAIDARAAALVGLGRVLRAQRQFDGARRAYDDLARLGPVIVAGQPADLVARQGRARTFESGRDSAALDDEVDELARVLYAGRWPIDRSTFELYRDLVVQWGGPQPPAVDVARSEAAGDLWRMWRRGDLGARGRRLVQKGPATMLALWTTSSTGQATLRIVADTDMLTAWGPLWRAQGLEVALSSVEGQPIAGERLAGGITLAPSDTRLPFILTASFAAGDDSASARRQLFLVGLVAAVLLTLGASYALYRTTTREIALARQQADFVSSVSHEFRTPLTSMRHLTELLATNSITSEERRRHYYELLAHETERLHRMVDSLLSFGRMSAGAYAWQLESAEIGDLVSAVVDEFRRDAAAEHRQVTSEVDANLPGIRADRDALSRALWNLLENAAKYSEPSAPIRVFARSQGDTVLVGVQDAGTGIPASEHKRIFQKFVRGDDATRAGVRGVGIGLALVTRIAEAHGGSVRLESEPGRGSTFTLVLPCLES
jgi:two-component system, OmpR family, phosphate regulon sensor histidine kinase PhoR